jgi:uncharacterized protein YceK
MSARKKLAGLLLGVAIAGTGCASAVNDVVAREAYGGVRIDAELLKDRWESPAGKILVAADVPLSFVVDTASLPVTLPCTLAYMNRGH